MPREPMYDIQKPVRHGAGCKCCVSEFADDINAELVAGVSLQAIATKYNLSKQNVYQHKRNHLMALDSPQGLSFITLHDIVNIPMQMKERSEVIKALLERALEPLQGPGPYKGLKHTQTDFIVRLLRLQQIDEQTVLKITGVLRDDSGQVELADGETVISEQYQRMSELIEARLSEMAEGDGELAAQAREIVAKAFLPSVQGPDGADMPDVSERGKAGKQQQPMTTTYVDLGAWGIDNAEKAEVAE